MKKVMLALLVAFLAAQVAFANGRGETLTEIEGSAVFQETEKGIKSLSIQTRDGKLIQVAINEPERNRLKIENSDQIRIKGVFLGETDENQVQARIFARTMTISGKTFELTDPVQLTKQEREQVRAYESNQAMQQLKTEEGLNSVTGNDSGSGSNGSSGGSNAASGSGPSSKGKD